MKPADPRGTAARKQRRDLIILWAFFAVWGAGAFGAFYIFAIKAYTPLGALISGALALAGAYFIWRMIRMTADDAKFGVVTLTPSAQAVDPGGTLKAALRFLDHPPGLQELDVELRCIRVTLTKRSRTGIVPVEELAWSHHQRIPLRHDRADIRFDLPGDAPVTDLPGERRGESGWQSLPVEHGKPWEFHRWEVLVSANVPGIDLERNFPVVVGQKEPRSAEVGATTSPVDSFRPRRTGFKLEYVVAGLIVATAMSQVLPPLLTPKPAEPMQPPPAAPQPPVQTGELLPRTPWTIDTSGWSMPMPDFSRHLGIAANGIRAIREAGNDRFVFDEVIIEKNPAWSHIDFFDLVVDITYYPADPAVAGTIGGFSTRLADIRGRLTQDNPTFRSKGLSVVVPRPGGAIGRTTVKLGINAVSAERKRIHDKSRELVMDER